MSRAVILHQAKQATVVRGHPWVFPKAIAKRVGHPTTGELVNIISAEGETLGIGVYNEHSLYQVRVLVRHWEQVDCSSLASIVKTRLSQALLLRRSLNLPNQHTTAFRLFNSEADGLSGLTIDQFNNRCVVASSAYWVEANRSLIMACLMEMVACEEILWSAQIKPLTQDGWINGASENMPLLQEEILEEGITFQIDFSSAQKTGLFLDQRDNHQRMAAISRGKRVLDLYTYSGGFALHAAKAGALQVTGVDSSRPAIELAKHNAQLNNLSNVEFITADARDYLTRAGEYDVIILDPPKLIPSKRDLNRAKNYYRFLHREVFKVMKPGSLLMTCNCSSALSSQEFAGLVSTQAAMVGKQSRLLGIFGPASCHPTLAAFPEGQYLTAVLFGIV